VRVRLEAGIHIVVVVVSVAMVWAALKMLLDLCSGLWSKRKMSATERRKYMERERKLWWQGFNERRLNFTANGGL